MEIDIICTQITREGVHKVVGNGESTEVWADPWIPTLPNFRVLTGILPSEAPRKVADIMLNGQWNQGELRRWFTRWEIEEILRIPIQLQPCEDQWTWHYSKNGEFSVRSAYFLELAERKRARATSSRETDNVVWCKLWQANLPTKIRIFAWKALHQGLPLRDNLRKRGWELDCRCPMCGETNETASHALISCTQAKRVWGLSPLRLTSPDDYGGTIMEWVTRVSRNVNEDIWWDILWSLMWGIWLRRNAWMFENRKVGSVEVMGKVVHLVHEYVAAMEEPSSQQNSDSGGPRTWKAPDHGLFKINSDVAVFGDGKLDFGGIVRDEMGEVMLATCAMYDGESSTDIGEALAARHAVKTAVEAGLWTVVLESDSLKLITHLKKGVKETTNFGFIISDILFHGSFCLSLSFNHVHREGNRVAHKLAHLSKEFRDMRVWIEEIPHEVWDIVNSDLLSMNA